MKKKIVFIAIAFCSYITLQVDTRAQRPWVQPIESPVVHPDRTVTFTNKFAWICSSSAYLTPEVFNKYFGNLSVKPEVTNKKLKLLWLSVGNEDFLCKPAITIIYLLKEKKIEQKNLITAGGHTWMNARLYLTETVQLFFK